MNSIVDQFNLKIDNNKLIVLNELQSIDGNGSRFDMNAINETLKSIKSDHFININSKFKDEKLVKNIEKTLLCFWIVCSVNIELKVRRYIILNE